MAELIGKTIASRYNFQDYIGRGGMADVYRVWDSERMVYLAAKVLHQELAMDRVFLRRFEREADTLAKLQHPNVVRSYGLEQGENLAFLLLDYVEGKTLKQVIYEAGEPMPGEQVHAILKAVTGALQFAHNQGMVHCDIKPSNIMVHRNGTVLLTDFGIARMTDAATATMVGVGTPAYMAPEQIKGQDPTPQTDIYALGIVLYEMFTGGERPFTGEKATTGSTSEKVRWEQLNLTPPPPSDWNPELPLAVEEVILKCLEKDPQKRYKSVVDLLNALQLAMEVELPSGEIDLAALSADVVPLPVAEEEKEARVVPETQRKRPGVLSYLGIAAALITLASLVWLFSSGVLARESASSPIDLSAAGSAQGESEDASGIQTLELTETPNLPTLTPTLPPTPTPDPYLIAAWNANQIEVLRVIEAHTDSVRRLVWSPDGTKLASASNDTNIHILDPQTGEILMKLTNHSEPVEGLDWSPDGRYLASAGWDQTARIWDADTGEQIQVLRGHTRALSGVAWSPDGQYLATISYDFTLRIWNTTDWSLVQEVEAHKGDIKSVAWSSDSSLVATGGKDGRVNLWNPVTGEEVRALWGHADYVMGVAWSPEGSRLATGGFDNTVRIWDAQSGDEIRYLDRHQAKINAVAWSPVSDVVASGGWEFIIGFWDAESGKPLRFLRGHRNAIWTIAWSPDGMIAASGDDDGKIFLWGIGTSVSEEEQAACDAITGKWVSYNDQTGDLWYELVLTSGANCSFSGYTVTYPEAFLGDVEANYVEGVLQFLEYGDEPGCYFFGDLELVDGRLVGEYSHTCGGAFQPLEMELVEE